MTEEPLFERGTTLVRRLILEPGESTPWHVDPFHRVTVVVRGDALALEFRDGGSALRIEVQPGLSDWDEPSDRVQRARNIGSETYEEVTVFFLDRRGATPQPRLE
jgi:hypothetical protein